MNAPFDSDRRLGDDGSVTLFVTVIVIAMFAATGLVVDGGAKLRATQRADRVAAEAARAGGQQVDAAAAIGDGIVRAQPSAATKAAKAYLRGTGFTGTTQLSRDRRQLTVRVTVTEPTVFLGLVGVSRWTATGQATVQLVRTGLGG